MRRHRIHVPQLAPGETVVAGAEADHLVQVLRVAQGSEVRAFDGSGNEADGVVLAAEPGRVVVELGAVRASEVEASLRVTVGVSLLKGDKLSDVVRQCTELGATSFRPLLSRRRDVPELSRNKLERLRRVAREAAKQSGRAVVPDVLDPVDLASLSWEGVALIAHPGASLTISDLFDVNGGRVSDHAEAGSSPDPTVAAPVTESTVAVAGTDRVDSAHSQGPGRPPQVTVITGPEGGFSPEEVEQLASRGARPVRLGARVLRAETAPVAMLAALLVRRAL